MDFEANLVSAIPMPEWLSAIEEEGRSRVWTDDADKVRLTIHLAEANVRHDGGPFGAAIFETASGRLVAVGVNRVTAALQSWAHAEMVAIARAQWRLGRGHLATCMLVTSCEPCAMCYGATPWSGVEALVYGASGDSARAIGFDEGDKVPDWRGALEKRGIRVTGPLCPAESDAPFRLYRARGGVIY